MKLTKSKLKRIIKEELAFLGALETELNFARKHGLLEQEEEWDDAPEGQEDYDYGYSDGSDRKPLEQDPAVPYHPEYIQGYKDGLYDSHMADNPDETHAAAAPVRSAHASEMKARIAAQQHKSRDSA